MISLVSEGQLLPAVLWFSLSSFDLVGAWDQAMLHIVQEQCYAIIVGAVLQHYFGSIATFIIVGTICFGATLQIITLRMLLSREIQRPCIWNCN